MLLFCFVLRMYLNLFIHHYHLYCPDICRKHDVKSLSPSLGSVVSHLSISRPFPCGWTLLSHLSSHINPHRPQITAPLRLVQGTVLDH